MKQIKNTKQFKDLTDMLIQVKEYLENSPDDAESVSSMWMNTNQIGNKLAQIKVENMFGVEFDSMYSYCIKGHHPTKIYIHKYSKDSPPNNIDTMVDEEYLLHFWFSTGAYSFHQDYPTETFGMFIEELLKKFTPKHYDSLNRHFYYDHTNAKEAIEGMKELFFKYKDKIDDELNKRKILKLEQELKLLKGGC